MWANAQRDGRRAEYRWRPLFNAANFGWRPLVECRAVTLPRRETHWNLQVWLKLANRSQPVVCRSSPYYEDMWRRYCCLVFNNFLANVSLRSRSLYAIAPPSVVCLSSVCLSSVTFVRPTQAVEIFGNFSTAFSTFTIRWHQHKILRRSSQGNPSAEGVKHKRGIIVKYSDVGPIEGYISETVQDRR